MIDAKYSDASSAESVGALDAKTQAKIRYDTVIRYSTVGIIGNVLLSAFKAVVGFAAGSIAVVLDAVNNLTDVFSSVATIVGEKISCMRPSRKHPYGFGRIEYVTSIVIAAFILAAGLISFWESLQKILHPSEPEYTALTIAVLTVATIIKVFMGVLFIRCGKKINSQPLKASGIDALYDAILTFGTLASAVICLTGGINLDGWVGLVISLFVIKAGIDVLREAVASIIGVRPAPETAHKIRSVIAEHEGVRGVFDLMIDSFGPEKFWVACRIEVCDEMRASEIHELTRHISEDLARECNAEAILGVYASNSTGEYAAVHKKLNELIDHHPEILQVHGFYVDEDTKHVDFDLVIDFTHDASEVRDHIVGEMKTHFPQYTYNVITDLDYTV